MTVVAACAAPGDDPRTGFLIDALTIDNQRWLDRDPAALAGKYQAMATRGFDFFRGTAGVYWRDVSEGGPVAAGTRFGDAGSAWLWLRRPAGA